jgi:hypothetical protein
VTAAERRDHRNQPIGVVHQADDFLQGRDQLPFAGLGFVAPEQRLEPGIDPEELLVEAPSQCRRFRAQEGPALADRGFVLEQHGESER